MPTFANGRWGEAAARVFLEARGYEVLECNFRTRYGEIDLIVREKRTIIFVEVKTRLRDTGTAEAAVDGRKQMRICKAAHLYSRRAPDALYRFDVVVVLHSPGEATARIRHYRHAFDMTLVF